MHKPWSAFGVKVEPIAGEVDPGDDEVVHYDTPQGSASGGCGVKVERIEAELVHAPRWVQKPFVLKVGVIANDQHGKIFVWPEQWARPGRYPNITGMRWPLIMDHDQKARVFALNLQVLHWIRWHPRALHCRTDLVCDHNCTPFYTIASISRMSKMPEDTIVFTCVFMNYINDHDTRRAHKRGGPRNTHRRYEISTDTEAIAALRSRSDPLFDHSAAGPY